MPGYRQAGTPVANFTRGNKATAINADPPPSRMRAGNFLNRFDLKITIKRIIAAPSVKKAKMGLMMAPSVTGSMSNKASNNLNTETMHTIRIGTKKRRDAIHPAERKNNPAPVIRDPDIWAAHALSPIPSATSLNPHMAPIVSAMLNGEPIDLFSMDNY